MRNFSPFNGTVFLLPDFKNSMKHDVKMSHAHFIEISPSLYHSSSIVPFTSQFKM